MTTSSTRTDFAVDISDRAPGFNLPQKVGRLLWAPMLVMALMAFPLGFILAVVRASLIGSSGDPNTITALGHFGPAAMFIGFATVFAAIAFAIARILGAFRTGGGAVQEASGRSVKTLKMLPIAKAFLGLMVMAMMILVGSVIAHVAIGAAVLNGDAAAIASAESSAIQLEAIRRVGVVLYLVSIALGLAAIAEVLRFQAIRLRELPGEAAR
jgi:hypothetical protein